MLGYTVAAHLVVSVGGRFDRRYGSSYPSSAALTPSPVSCCGGTSVMAWHRAVL